MESMNPMNSENANVPARKYIGYRGYWYDITDFVSRHPGGDVIEQFVGRDGTHVIETAHKPDVMKYRKPVDYAESNSFNYPKPYKYEPSLFERDMLTLLCRLKEGGYYDQSRQWFARKILIIACIPFVIFYLLCNNSQHLSVQLICGFMLAGFWQQSGLLMHDMMHSHVFQKYKIDERLGVFFGTLCFGMSSRWWKQEHTVHHALTNTVDYHTGFVDPQASEEVWAQNEKLLPFFRGRTQAFLIKIQYWTFVPLCIIAGRFAIIVDSMRKEKNKDVWLSFIIHWCWVIPMLSLLPDWKSRILVYFCAALGEGILHIQLLLNHYSKHFYEAEEMHRTGFFRAMIDCNINITSPWWLDWFHGGLNFHIEHHCFPRLPRNRCREVSATIKKICHKHGVVYDECSFTTALQKTLTQLRSVSKLYDAMHSI